MMLCEETSSVLDMLKPKVKLVEEACQCKLNPRPALPVFSPPKKKIVLLYVISLSANLQSN